MPLHEKAMKYFNTPIMPKFLATRDREGKVNVVPIVTIRTCDERTLAFGNMMLRKSERNLREDNRVSVCVFGLSGLLGLNQVPEFEELLFKLYEMKLNAFEVKGRFIGFEKIGEHYDAVASMPMLRYCAYQALRNVGVIEVEEVFTPIHEAPIEEMISGTAIQIELEKIQARKMHPNVAEKFGRMVAFRVIATKADGHPKTIPVLSMKAIGDTLIFGCASTDVSPLKEGDYMAASVLTDDAIAYQVKGFFKGFEKTEFGEIGKIDVEEVYSASPPRPGERIA